MHKRAQYIVGFAAVAAAVVFATEITRHSVKPKGGFVPDAKTAIERDGLVPDAETAIGIAVAAWEPIYGKDKIAEEKPYRARLDTNRVWIVEGSLPKGCLGGVATAEIAKDDGRVLRVSHGK
jgi:hypothetical protein